MQLPITIGLRRSFFLDFLVALVAGLAILCVLAFPASGLVRMAGLLVVAIFAIFAWRGLSPKFSTIRLESKGQLSVFSSHAAEFVAVELQPGVTVHPWLSVVRLKTDGGRIACLILARDSLAPEDFRRLRVFLRWRADFSAVDAAA